MRKFFTLIAALVFAVTAFAQATFVADPPDGSTVNELRTITLTSGDPRYSNIEVDNETAQVISSSSVLCNLTSQQDGSATILTLPTVAANPGTYYVTFAPGTWRLVNPSNNDIIEGEYAYLTYTIANTGELVSEPACWSDVEAPFESIDVTYSNTTGEWPFIGTNLLGGVKIYKGDMEICGVTGQTSSDNKKVTLTFEQPLTEPGEYTIKVPSTAFDVFTSNWESRKSAGTAEFTFNVTAAEAPKAIVVSDPADGSTVTELNTITLTSGDPRYPNLVVDKDAALLSWDGGYTYPPVTIDGSATKIIIDPAKTEPGKYTLTLYAGWRMVNPSTNESVKGELTNINFTIAEAGGGEQPVEVALVADPASGSTVEAPFNSIDLTSNSAEYSKLSYTGTGSITVKKDGADYGGVTTQSSEDGKKLTLTFDQPITEAGEYTITVSQYAIDVWSDTDFKNPGGEFTYTVTAAAEKPEATLVSNPADGSTVTELSTVELASDTPGYPTVNVVDVTAINVVKDHMTRFCGVTAEQDGSNVILTLETPATEPGVYEIYFDENSWNVSNGSETLSKAAVLAFLIEDNGGGDVDDTVYIKATPEVGEVAELNEIELRPYDPAYNILTIENEEAITVTKDGQEFCGVTSDDTSDFCASIITLKTKATEPGTYVINFPAGSWTVFENTSYAGVYNKATTLTYTIVGGGEQPVEVALVADPASGSTVEAPFNSIDLTSNSAEYTVLSYNSTSSIKVLKDGADYCGVTTQSSEEGKKLTLTFEQPITEAGEYTISVSPYAIDVYKVNEEGLWTDCKNPGGEFTYTVTAAAEKPEAALLSNPADGSTVTELSTVELASDTPGYPTVNVVDVAAINVVKDHMTRFCGVTAEQNGTNVILTLETPATEPGVYEIYFDENSWNVSNGSETLSKAAVLSFLIEDNGGGDVDDTVYIKATPEVGEVAELNEIELRPYDPAYNILTIENEEAITVTKDGQEFCGVTSDDTSDFCASIITLKKKATEPGTYVINFPAGSWTVFENTSYAGVYGKATTLTYTISGTAAPKASLVATPAPGKVTEPLTQILLSSGVEEYPVVDILSKDEVKVLKDDVEFCGIVQGDMSMNGYNIKLTKEVTESGIYKVVLPAGSWEIANYDPEYVALEGVDFELVYDVDLGGPRYDIPFVLSSLTPDIENADISIYDGEIKTMDIKVIGNVKALPDATVTISCKRNGYSQQAKVTAGEPMYFDFLKEWRTTLFFTLETGITTDGTYTIDIPRGIVGDEAYCADRTSGHANMAEVIELVCFGGKPAPEPTVVYDLGIKSTKPAEGTIDLSEKAWEVTNFNIDAAYDLAPNSTATATLVCESAGYNQSGKVEFSMISFDGTSRTMKVTHPEPTKNGTYVLTIPQGTFGDAEWREDQNAGHSNPEIKAYFMVTGFGDAETVYDIEIASTTPADKAKVNIAETPASFTFTAAGDYDFYPMMDISVACEGAEYNGTAKVTAATVADGVTTFTTVLSEPITVNGDYTVTIPQGVIGDDAYIANWTTGHANKEYAMTFTVEGGIPQKEPLKYDLNPTVTPENGSQLAVEQTVVIALVFPEGTVRASEDARASLVCESANYFDTAYFMPAETSGTFQLTFGTKPTREGTYSLTVAEGTFIDAAQAHANPELNYSWEIKDTAIDSIFTDEEIEGGVYNINGVYVGDSLKNLPAGIYVVKGRKVMNTK